jgi:hypothetical protein
MVFGREPIMTVTLGSGFHQKLMAMVCTLGQMEIGTKDNGECVLNMDKVKTTFLMAISILVCMKMVNLMEKENISGVLDKFIQEIFIEDLNKVEENGGVPKINQLLQIYMKVSIKMTKNMDKEFSLGQLVIFIKEIIAKMKDMEMDKCFGLIVLCMKENGKKESNMAKDVLFCQMEQ